MEKTVTTSRVVDELLRKADRLRQERRALELMYQQVVADFTSARRLLWIAVAVILVLAALLARAFHTCGSVL